MAPVLCQLTNTYMNHHWVRCEACGRAVGSEESLVDSRDEEPALGGKNVGQDESLLDDSVFRRNNVMHWVSSLLMTRL